MTLELLTVGYNIGNAILVSIIRFSFVEENSRRPIRHQTPVLHGAHGLENVLSARSHIGQHVRDALHLQIHARPGGLPLEGDTLFRKFPKNSPPCGERTPRQSEPGP